MGTKDIPGGAAGLTAAWHTTEGTLTVHSTEVDMGSVSEDPGRRGDRDEEE